MEIELGKLFIGGISWDTNEDRLREYFQNFGEVVEAVIMKDRNTGRARGFGFVVFADPYVAERVVMEKHVIDGRTVEAKKAVPRDDQTMNRNSSSIQGSPGPTRTKKIFVGGLASTVTESDFKDYFDQFGMITDVVVMYDHNTQRPRGFGFITYDSEESVEKVLLKTFHELNGKMVEVKRAVPKELSPGPNRNQLGTFNNYGLSRVSSLLNAYTQGYNQSPIGGYGRFSPVNIGRSGYSPLSPSGYGLGLNFETGLGQNYGGAVNINSNLGGYGRGVNPLFSGQQNRYGNTVGLGSGPSMSSMHRNLWGHQSLNYGTNSGESNAFMGFENGSLGAFGNLGEIWSSPNIGQRGTSSPYNNSGSVGYGNENNNFGLGEIGYTRNTRTNLAPVSSYAASNGSHDGGYGDFYEGRSIHGAPTWQPSSSELEGSGPFDFGLRNAGSGATPKSSVTYVDGYGVNSRQSIRGIAA